MSVSRPWAWLTILVIAETVSGFESSMMLVGLGAWMRQYHDTISVSWIVSSYVLVQAGAAALLSPLGDVFGRKRLLVIAIAGAAIGSVVSAMAPSLGWIVVGRSIQGMAGAILPLCFGLVRENLPAERVPFSVGVLTAAAAISAAGGFIIGGVVTDRSGPQSMFVVSAVVALVALLLTALFLPASRTGTRPERLDLVGGLLFVPGVTGLLLVLSDLSTWSAGTSFSIGLACIAVLVWWWQHEYRHPTPLIDVRLFGKSDIRLANLVMAGCALGAMGVTQVTSMLLQQDPASGAGFGLSATAVGVLKSPMLVGGTLGSLWAGWASGRWSGRVPMVAGSVGIVSGLALLAVDHAIVWLIIAAVVFIIAATTALYTGVPNVIIAASPAKRTSEVVGLSAVVRALFQAIGAQTIAVILAASTVGAQHGGKGLPSDRAFSLVFAFMAAAGLISLGAALATRRGRLAQAVSEPIAGLASDL